MAVDSRKREGQQLLLRFTDGSDLRARLEEVARKSNRSLTAEILTRLEASLDGDADARSAEAAKRLLHPASALLEKRVEELEARVAKLEG